MELFRKIACTLIIPAMISTSAWADENRPTTKKLLILPDTSASDSPKELGGLTRGISIGSTTEDMPESTDQSNVTNDTVDGKDTGIAETRDENANQTERQNVIVQVEKPRIRKVSRKKSTKGRKVRVARYTSNRRAIKLRGAIVIGVYR